MMRVGTVTTFCRLYTSQTETNISARYYYTRGIKKIEENTEKKKPTVITVFTFRVKP